MVFDLVDSDENSQWPNPMVYELTPYLFAAKASHPTGRTSRELCGNAALISLLSTFPYWPDASTFSIVKNTGENRPCSPTLVLMSLSEASATISRTCSKLSANGHSMKASFPALMLGRALGDVENKVYIWIGSHLLVFAICACGRRQTKVLGRTRHWSFERPQFGNFPFLGLAESRTDVPWDPVGILRVESC